MTLISEQDKLFFHHQSSSNEWKSPKITLPLLQPSSTIGTCLISIKFNTFRQGEVKVVKSLLGLLLHQMHCDVKFCFEDGRHVGGHIPILANRNPVFAAMFNHDMQEKKTGKVVTKDIQPEIFKEMLHYIYAGRTRISIVECTARPGRLGRKVRHQRFEGRVRTISHLAHTKRKRHWADRLCGSVQGWGNQRSRFQICGRKLQNLFPTTEWENLMKNDPDLCLLVTRRMIQ